MPEATLVRKLKKWRGDARLYKIDPPFETNFHPWNDTSNGNMPFEYIIISSVSGYGARNYTEVFGTTKSANVEVLDKLYTYTEKDHEKVLRKMGYDLVGPEPKARIKKVAEVKQTRYLRLED